jgi:Zn-dependent protease with chaperone function
MGPAAEWRDRQTAPGWTSPWWRILEVQRPLDTPHFGLIRAPEHAQNCNASGPPSKNGTWRSGESVGLPAVDCLSFQEAEASAGPGDDLCRVDLSHIASTSQPGTSPICEKIFIAGSGVAGRNLTPTRARRLRTLTKRRPIDHCLSLLHYARLAICATGFLFCLLPAWVLDAHGSLLSDAAEHTSTSASSSPQTASGAEEQTGKSGKFDTERIGQRNIGKGLNLYSLEKERALGESMAAAIDRGTTFVRDRDINDYINRLGQKIARNSDAQVPFTIKVIDSSELRTFALPGGFLYVDKGLIMEVDSEAELAGLMAHEIAHVAARHATRFATRKYAWNLMSIPLAYIGGPAGLGTKQIGPLTLRKFNRDAEIEADLLGMEYQYAAGYDPEAFVEALEKLHSKETQMRARLAKTLPVFGFLAKVPLHDQIARAFANYPPTEERIRRVQVEIATMLPSREDYISDTSEFQEVKAKLAWADRPILRRHRSGDAPDNAPVLHRRSSQEGPQQLASGPSPASVISCGQPAR